MLAGWGAGCSLLSLWTAKCSQYPRSGSCLDKSHQKPKESSHWIGLWGLSSPLFEVTQTIMGATTLWPSVTEVKRGAWTP